jgi:capsular polysaccharide biosynthesis protein
MTIDSNRATAVPAPVEDNSLDHFQDYDEFPVMAEGTPEGTPEGTQYEPAARMVGLGFIGAAIKRRTRFWLVFGALGLLIGSALFVKMHPTYQVTVTMLMVNDQTIDQPTAMQTDALLAVNPAFAQQVLGKLGLNETATSFLKTYSVTNVSTQLLSITDNAPSPADATTRATVLANGYLTFRAGMLREQLSQMLAAANQQVTKAEDALSAVNSQITQVAAEPASATQQQTLKSLQNQRTQADDYLISMQQTAGSDAANKQVTVSSMISGSRVIDTTAPVLAHSRSKTALEYVGGGAFGGAVLGMGIIAVGAVMSTRLRRRDDVAAALGAPVRLSVATFDGGGRLSRRTGPKRDTRRVVAHLRGSLKKGEGETPALAVVAVDNPKFVASLVLQAAVACANDGKQVMVADLSGGALARLLGQDAPGVHTVAKGGGRIVLVVPDPEDLTPRGPLPQGGPESLAAAFSAADVLIALVTVDPATGADYLGSWATDTVAVVTAGLSTTEKVQSVGELIRGGGIATVSGVLLGADRSDESLGL